MKTLLTLTVCTAILSSSVSAEDWPAWRGPRGDGISHESNVPLTWSSTENIAWKLPLPGIGRSSPIVWGDRVFVTASDESDQSRRVICANARTGELLWNIPVHHGPPGKMHKFNTPASSTPATDGERIYAAFIDDQGMSVSAVDMQGNIVWSVCPGTFHSSHGFSASPVIYGDGVIVNGQQDGDAFVVMLDRKTGDEIWRYKPAVNLRSFSTPLIIQHEGRDQLILTGATETAGLDPATGRKIWFANGPSEKFVSTPSVGHGLVFSFGGSDEKKAMAVRLGGEGDVLGTHVVWRNERSMPYVPTPLLAGDYLHIVNDMGIYTCLEPKSGKVLMAGRKLGSVYSSPIAVADRIYLFEDSGDCTVIKNNDQFEVLAKNSLGEVVYSTPAVSKGCLYVRSEGHLFRIGSPAVEVTTK